MRSIDSVKPKTGNVKETKIRRTNKNEKEVNKDPVSKCAMGSRKENQDARKHIVKHAVKGEGGKLKLKESDRTPG